MEHPISTKKNPVLGLFAYESLARGNKSRVIRCSVKNCRCWKSIFLTASATIEDVEAALSSLRTDAGFGWRVGDSPDKHLCPEHVEDLHRRGTLSLHPAYSEVVDGLSSDLKAAQSEGGGAVSLNPELVINLLLSVELDLDAAEKLLSTEISRADLALQKVLLARGRISTERKAIARSLT